MVNEHIKKTTFSILLLLERIEREKNKPFRGTQREYSSKPLKHGILKRILVVTAALRSQRYVVKA